MTATDGRTGTTLIPIELPAAKAFLLRGPGGCVLVDTGIPPALPKLKRSLQELVPDLSALKLILITHGHTDHIGGAKALHELSGAPIAMHSADAGMADGTTRENIKPRTLAGRLAKPLTSLMPLPVANQFRPDFTITDAGFDLCLYGVDAEVIHTPGHTPGSLSVWLADGTALVADLVMPVPFAPYLPGMPMFADDVAQVREHVLKVLALKPRQIACSHGGPFTPEAVAKAFGIQT
jgi:hydroxyacylglutathione hydrolase